MTPISMDCSLDIFKIYRRYCAIVSDSICMLGKDELQGVRVTRERLSELLKVMESKFSTRYSIFDEVCKLQENLVHLKEDCSNFTHFYNFVFLMCRENGQRGITVSKALMAWRLVLAGRFRLLNEWCDFVEKNHKHDISEDTWRELLLFTYFSNGSLEGYDPQGAWPSLIDSFVEYISQIEGCCADVDSHRHSRQNAAVVRSPATATHFIGCKRKFDDDMMASIPGNDATACHRRRNRYVNLNTKRGTFSDVDSVSRVEPIDFVAFHHHSRIQD